MLRTGPRSNGSLAGVYEMEADLAQTARVFVETADAVMNPEPAAGRPIDLVHLAKQTFGERDLEARLPTGRRVHLGQHLAIKIHDG